jgi:hypothetical protein
MLCAYLQVILCIKEVNEKARILAIRLVTDLGYAAQRCFGKKADGKGGR